MIADIVPATDEDAAFIGSNLRPHDMMELKAHGIDTDDATLVQSVVREILTTNSDARAVRIKDEPIAIYGICPSQDPRIGHPWFLGTARIGSIRMQFIRESRVRLAEIACKYDLIWNTVWAGNRLHIRWLSWLEFSFKPQVLNPTTNEPFIPFHMEPNLVLR